MYRAESHQTRREIFVGAGVLNLENVAVVSACRAVSRALADGHERLAPRVTRLVGAMRAKVGPLLEERRQDQGTVAVKALIAGGAFDAFEPEDA